MEKAVVLLSGGLDSCTCMAVAKSKGYDVYPISFNYHQRHSIELEGAKKIAAFYGVKRHLIIETNMDAIGGFAPPAKKKQMAGGGTHRPEGTHKELAARHFFFFFSSVGY